MISLEQHSIGIPEMKIANLFEDIKVVKEVQDLSCKILADDPNLEQEKNGKLKKLIANKFTKRIEI